MKRLRVWATDVLIDGCREVLILPRSIAFHLWETTGYVLFGIKVRSGQIKDPIILVSEPF